MRDMLTVHDLLDRVYPEQKIHTQTSGRWSTTNPPLAQIPKKLRNLFRADPGYRILSFDWDQIELRISAAISHDEPSLEAFANEWDIHTLNACDIFGFTYPPDKRDPHKSEVCRDWRILYAWEGKDDPHRVFAKRFVYRLDYGGDPKLAGDIPGAKVLGLTPQKLTVAARNYLVAHPAKAKYRDRLAVLAKTTRCVRTWTGRRRILNGGVNEIVREAFNHPMQGGVADVFNLTLLRIRKACPYMVWLYGMHDSQKWLCPNNLYADAIKTVQAIVNEPWMIHGVSVKLPVTFDDIQTPEEV